MKIARLEAITDPFAPGVDTAAAISVVADDFDFEAADTVNFTSPESLLWCFESRRRGMDYKRFRKDAASWYTANAGDWASFTVARKTLLARYFCVPFDKQLEVADQAQIGEWGVEFHEASILCRQKRGRAAGSVLYGILGMAQMSPLINAHGQLIWLYMEFGQEGTTEGDSVGLFDYIESTDGTAYEGAGLAEESLIYPPGYSAEIVIGAVMGILRDGAY